MDECTLNTHDGSSKADCSNLLGSFQCACKQGFTGDGKTCQGRLGNTLMLMNLNFLYHHPAQLKDGTAPHPLEEKISIN